MIVLWILLAVAVLTLLTSYICYRIVFYAKPAGTLGPDEYDIPHGEVYDVHSQQMLAWQKEVRQLPSRDLSVQSFDGLTLWGKYYKCAPGAVTELMMHGYRGSAERDLCGGVQRAFSLGRNVLLVDQRTSRRSQGNTITFGINEYKDCLSWVARMVQEFGPDVKIILTGISMGASTVLTAAGQDLPPNVVGVLADCGYSTAKAIICKCAGEMGLPPKLIYPFIKLGAKLYGHFDLEQITPLEALKKCKVPVIFFHGEADDFVPCDMSRELYEACASAKRLVTVPGAGHGLSYMIEPERYLREVADFFTANGVPTQVQ